MARHLFLIILTLLGSSSLIGQNSVDKIEVEKKMATVFTQNGQRLVLKQLLSITKDVPQAYERMSIAKNNYTAAQALGGIGGGLIGWPIGTAIGGGDPNWTLAGIGVAVIVVSIPFNNAYLKHAKKGAEIYNESLVYGQHKKAFYSMAISEYGIGVKWTF